MKRILQLISSCLDPYNIPVDARLSNPETRLLFNAELVAREYEPRLRLRQAEKNLLNQWTLLNRYCCSADSHYSPDSLFFTRFWYSQSSEYSPSSGLK